MKKFKFCPVCSGQLSETLHRSHRRLICNECGFILYQNPKPTASMYIVKDRKVLLGKRGLDPFKGYWSNIGGFVELGESSQEAAIRETKEETGLDVKIIEILGIGRDFYGNEEVIPAAFIGQVVGGREEPGDDVEELKWFDLTNLPENMAFVSNKKAIELLKDRYLD